MKNVIRLGLFVSALILPFSSQAYAANLELKWVDVDGYTDLRALNMRQEAFELMVFKELSRQFQKSTDDFLAQGQTLSITVTDLDLAGRVDYDYTNIRRQRILKGYEFPALSFNYEVKDENNLTISSGEESIKALNFKSANKLRYVGNNLHHERSLINDWFVGKF